MNIEDFRNVKRIGYTPFLDYEGLTKYGIALNRKNISFQTRFKELEYGLDNAEVDGFNLEFGVHKGLTLNYAADINPSRHWYGFDTFQGLDEPWEFAENKTISMTNFNLRGNIPKMRDNVTLIKGLFQDTLKEFIEETLKDSPISFLHLDADIYSSTKYVLTMLNKNIVPGTIIRFDELCCWRHEGFEDDWKKSATIQPSPHYTKWREGEWKALLEWLEEEGREVEPLWRAWFQGAGIKVIK